MVTHQDVGVAIHRSHRLSRRKHLTIEALRNEHFIVVPREYDPDSHDKLISQMTSIGAQLKIIAYETPSLNVIARVSVNEGVALIPLGYRSESNDAIHVIPLRDPQLSTTPIYAAYRLDNTRPTVEHFMKSLAL
jgi:DNA-binding transcriptional LysR family regulator